MVVLRAGTGGLVVWRLDGMQCRAKNPRLGGVHERVLLAPQGPKKNWVLLRT